MSMNWWGIVISYAFVFGVLGAATVLLKTGVVTAAVSRKLVHIGVSNWWFLAMLFFDRWQFAIVGPISFIFINLASYLFRLMPAMEHEVRTRNLGTVYFPAALLVLVLLGWAGPMPVWVAGMGILVMGYGDGLASLLGEHLTSKAFRVSGNTKSVAGTAVMFIAASVVVVCFILLFSSGEAQGSPAAGSIVLSALVTATVATVIELITPWGMDNLTVPILTALFYYAVFV
jgi:phytol kinase